MKKYFKRKKDPEVFSRKPDDLLPGVLFDKKSAVFEIYGESCPENVSDFYDPVFDWIDAYCEDPLKKTVFDFKLTYFNTASAKVFLMIMMKMEEVRESGSEVKIRWYYVEDDDDLKEAGEEFESIVELDFELIPQKDESNKLKNEAHFKNLMDDIL